MGLKLHGRLNGLVLTTLGIVVLTAGCGSTSKVTSRPAAGAAASTNSTPQSITSPSRSADYSNHITANSDPCTIFTVAEETAIIGVVPQYTVRDTATGGGRECLVNGGGGGLAIVIYSGTEGYPASDLTPVPGRPHVFSSTPGIPNYVAVLPGGIQVDIGPMASINAAQQAALLSDLVRLAAWSAR